MLARFESDLRYLASVELHPALHTSASSSLAGSGGPAGGTGLSGAASATSPASSAVSAASAAGGSGSLGGAPTLLQLVEAPALREAAAAASRGHAHFSGKVGELEGLFAALKAELEALFMQVGSQRRMGCEGMHGATDCMPELTRHAELIRHAEAWMHVAAMRLVPAASALCVRCAFHRGRPKCCSPDGNSLPQAPSVDLEALTRQLEEMHGQVDDQVSWAGRLMLRGLVFA